MSVRCVFMQGLFFINPDMCLENSYAYYMLILCVRSVYKWDPWGFLPLEFSKGLITSGDSSARLLFCLNQIKSNHFYCHITTAQVPWWVKFLWACSRQCKKTTDNLPMDRQCKKNNKQFTYGQTVQKNCTGAFTVLQTVQKKQQQFTYGQTVQKNNSNLHMDSTYLQTVQKTMCKIHIHILSTLSVL